MLLTEKKKKWIECMKGWLENLEEKELTSWKNEKLKGEILVYERKKKWVCENKTVSCLLKRDWIGREDWQKIKLLNKLQ